MIFCQFIQVLEKLYQRNPEDEILRLIETTMGEIGPIIHTWLKGEFLIYIFF